MTATKSSAPPSPRSNPESTYYFYDNPGIGHSWMLGKLFAYVIPVVICECSDGEELAVLGMVGYTKVGRTGALLLVSATKQSEINDLLDQRVFGPHGPFKKAEGQ